VTEKIKVLAISDWADTGFGRVMKELLPRLAATGLFEIEMVGWCYDGNPLTYDDARARGVRLHPPEGPWGCRTAAWCVRNLRPRIVLSLGDPWMVDWIRKIRGEAPFSWVAYVPIDRDPISESWRQMLAAPDVLVLYSRWGAEVVRRAMPFRHPEVVLHGVDCGAFKPLDPSVRRLARKSLGVERDEDFLVGMVARNQERKQVPRLLCGFRAFNCATRAEPDRPCEGRRWRCDGCPGFKQDPAKERSRIYLHMTMGDGTDPDDGRGVSWNVIELARRYGLAGRVISTRAIRVKRGVPSAELSAIYSCLDLHVITSKREGFCLPILEAMASGTPNAATDYSACKELVEDGGGYPLPVQTFVNEPHDEAEGAIVSIEGLAERLDVALADRASGLLRSIGLEGRRHAESLDWDRGGIVKQWTDLLVRVAGAEPPRRDPAPAGEPVEEEVEVS